MTTADLERGNATAPPGGKSADDPPPPAPMTETFAEWARLARPLFQPPDIVHQDRPSLAKEWAYADRGAWTTNDGTWRLLAKLDFIVFTVPLTAALAYLQWVVVRPARRYAALLLLTLWFWDSVTATVGALASSLLPGP